MLAEMENENVAAEKEAANVHQSLKKRMQDALVSRRKVQTYRQK